MATPKATSARTSTKTTAARAAPTAAKGAKTAKVGKAAKPLAKGTVPKSAQGTKGPAKPAAKPAKPAAKRAAPKAAKGAKATKARPKRLTPAGRGGPREPEGLVPEPAGGGIQGASGVKRSAREDMTGRQVARMDPVVNWGRKGAHSPSK